MSIPVALLEATIREQAGEIAILRIREKGYLNDIQELKAQLVEDPQVTPARKVRDGK